MKDKDGMEEVSSERKDRKEWRDLAPESSQLLALWCRSDIGNMWCNTDISWQMAYDFLVGGGTFYFLLPFSFVIIAIVIVIKNRHHGVLGKPIDASSLGLPRWCLFFKTLTITANENKINLDYIQSTTDCMHLTLSAAEEKIMHALAGSSPPPTPTPTEETWFSFLFLFIPST